MKILTRNECAQFLLSHDNFCILTHRRPDGDTIGSTAALCLGLRQLGKTAHVLFNAEVSARFAWLHEGLTKESVEEGDILVSVDVASPGMLGAHFAPLQEKIRLRIDHHGSGREYTPREYVDSEMASCCEIIWELLPELDVQMDKDGNPISAEILWQGRRILSMEIENFQLQ